MEKSLFRTSLALYLLVLVWLVLFKFSYDLPSVLLDHQTRSVNLIPFIGGISREMIDNFIVFIPFGLLLGVNLKLTGISEKLFYIFTFSFAVESLQFVLAIGTTDITDVIMNTLGGLFGLALYDFGKKYIHSKKLDLFIVVTGIILLTLLVLLRVLVFKVRY